MKQIKIEENEHDQRIDRFLKKYFSNATKSFIYKMLRKKRIKLNGKRANPEDIVYEGDEIQLYLSDETIEKFISSEKEIKKSNNLDVIYEDKNIAIINKPKGILSHSSSDEDEINVADEFVSYLYDKEEYIPQVGSTFAPSICNRLDRNTSGIIIGAKNYNTLKAINYSLKNRTISKYYKCIVKGKVKNDQKLEGFLVKDEETNKVSVSIDELEDSKQIETQVKVLHTNDEYSLLEINLITGRTHQIRAHLSSIGHPVIGDMKYGERKVNDFFKKRYGLNSQYLHAYKIIFDKVESELEYLNGKQFISEVSEAMKALERDLFDL